MSKLKYLPNGRPGLAMALQGAISLDKLFPADDAFSDEVRAWCTNGDLQGKLMTALANAPEHETEQQREAREALGKNISNMFTALDRLMRGANLMSKDEHTPEEQWNLGMQEFSTTAFEDLQRCVKHYNEATNYDLSAEPYMQALNGMMRGLTSVFNQLEQQAADEADAVMEERFTEMQNAGKDFESSLRTFSENIVIGDTKVNPKDLAGTHKKVTQEYTAVKKEYDDRTKAVRDIIAEADKTITNCKHNILTADVSEKFLEREAAEKELKAARMAHVKGVWLHLKPEEVNKFIEAGKRLVTWNRHVELLKAAKENGVSDREKTDLACDLAEEEYLAEHPECSRDNIPDGKLDHRTARYYKYNDLEALSKFADMYFKEAGKEFDKLVKANPEIRKYCDEHQMGQLMFDLNEIGNARENDPGFEERIAKANTKYRRAETAEADADQLLRNEMENNGEKNINVCNERIKVIKEKAKKDGSTKEILEKRKKENRNKGELAYVRKSEAEHYGAAYIDHLKKKLDYLEKVKAPLDKAVSAGDDIARQFKDNNVYQKNQEYARIHFEAKSACGDARMSNFKRQLKELYDRVDEARKEGHSDTTEFGHMKGSLEYVFGENPHELDAEALDLMVQTAQTYLSEKQKGIHLIKSPMRQYRIAFAKELKAIAEQALEATGKVPEEQNKLDQLKQDVSALETAVTREKLNEVVKKRTDQPDKADFGTRLHNRLVGLNNAIADSEKNLPDFLQKPQVQNPQAGL